MEVGDILRVLKGTVGRDYDDYPMIIIAIRKDYILLRYQRVTNNEHSNWTIDNHELNEYFGIKR